MKARKKDDERGDNLCSSIITIVILITKGFPDVCIEFECEDYCWIVPPLVDRMFVCYNILDRRSSFIYYHAHQTIVLQCCSPKIPKVDNIHHAIGRETVRAM